MSKKPDDAGPVKAGSGTRAVWGGEQVRHPYNVTQTPIVVSAAYGYDDIDVWYDVVLGKAPGFIYSRMSNPMVEILEAKICELELAESGVAFSSGMAAIRRGASPVRGHNPRGGNGPTIGNGERKYQRNPGGGPWNCRADQFACPECGY